VQDCMHCTGLHALLCNAGPLGWVQRCKAAMLKNVWRTVSSRGCHAHGFAWASCKNRGRIHAHAKPWAWHAMAPTRRSPFLWTHLVADCRALGDSSSTVWLWRSCCTPLARGAKWLSGKDLQLIPDCRFCDRKAGCREGFAEGPGQPEALASFLDKKNGRAWRLAKWRSAKLRQS
jgi:hypothetical protein